MVNFILHNTVAKAYQKDYIRTKHSSVTSQLPDPIEHHNLFVSRHERMMLIRMYAHKS